MMKIGTLPIFMLQRTDLSCWLGWKIQFQATQNILCSMVYMYGGGSTGSNYKSFLMAATYFPSELATWHTSHFRTAKN